MRAAVAACALACPPAAGATPGPPPCVAAAFSPAFARDRTVFCLTTSDEGVTIRRSGDAGRTWDAGRVVTTRPLSLPDVVVSPVYPGDPTVLVTGFEREAMWVSRDGGRTFAETDDGPSFGTLRLTSYVEPRPAPHVALVEGSLAMIGTHAFDALTGWRPVLGPPFASTAFIVPPDYGTTREAVAIGEDVTVEPNGLRPRDVRAYVCRGDFTCVTPVFGFGDVMVRDVEQLSPGDNVVVTYPPVRSGRPVPPPSALRVWRSRDHGRTWARWPQLETVIVAQFMGGRFPSVRLTKSPDAPRRLFLHLGFFRLSSPRAPGNQVWRSDDDGRTWRRIGYSWAAGQPNAGAGTLPWNDPGTSVAMTGPWLSAQPGGLLYALGARKVGNRVTRQHLWCSRDLGRTWRPAC